MRLAHATWAMVTIVGGAAAQTANLDPSHELQRQDQQRQAIRQRLETPPPGSQRPASRTPDHQRLHPEQPCSTIERIELEGALAATVPRAALAGIEGDDPPYGHCLGARGITLLMQRVQQSLAARGHLTSHVEAPEQDMRGGTLILRIREGRVGAIRSPDSSKQPFKPAWATAPGRILNLNDIEQTLDNLQRLPSLGAEIQIEPGEQAGFSDIVLRTEPAAPLRLGASLDDAGLPETGQLQGNLTLAWDNPLGLADLAYINLGRDMGGRDPGPRGTRSHIVHYSVPLGRWLIGATWSGNRYRQTQYGPYTSYLFHGSSSQKEVELQRVLHRDGSSKTTAFIKGFLRTSNHFIDELEVQVQRHRTAGWEAGVQHQRHTALGALGGRLIFRRGTGAWKAQPVPEEPTSRMQLVTGTVQWNMPLATGGWGYGHVLQWQWSRSRLSAQDQFCIGGRTTVHGFGGAETLCGDQGQLWRQELTAPLPGWPSAQAYAALDIGRTQARGSGPPERLGGLALGLRGQWQGPMRQPVRFDAFVGRPLSQPAHFQKPRAVTGFSLHTDF